MAAKTMKPAKTPEVKVVVRPEVNGVLDGKSEEKIRQLAYQKWEAAGKPDGDGLFYWLAAERELGPV